jgi:RNA polymerase sigma-70 factor (ECF subfamily)
MKTQQPLTPALTDPDLIARLLAHDEEAWTAVLRRHRSLIYRCITRATGRVNAHLCEADLDEIFSEFCVNLLRNDGKKLRAFDPARNVRLTTWLGLIAINTAFDYLRRRARAPLAQDRDDCAAECVSERPDPLDDLIAKEQRQVVRTLLDDLSERDQDFVHLFFEQGMEPEAVAATMHISVKTVYTKKHKINARLTELAGAYRVAA